MYMIQRLWQDESGSADYLFLILMFTICILGLLPGFATLRDQFLQQFGDMAVAFDSLDQSYSVNVNGVISEYSDAPTDLLDEAGSEPACISITDEAASPEG